MGSFMLLVPQSLRRCPDCNRESLALQWRSRHRPKALVATIAAIPYSVHGAGNFRRNVLGLFIRQVLVVCSHEVRGERDIALKTRLASAPPGGPPALVPPHLLPSAPCSAVGRRNARRRWARFVNGGSDRSRHEAAADGSNMTTAHGRSGCHRQLPYGKYPRIFRWLS